MTNRKRQNQNSLRPENIFKNYFQKWKDIVNPGIDQLRRDMQLISKSNIKTRTEDIKMIKVKTICELADMKEFSMILRKCYPYYAQYYHNATAGERTEYGNEFVTIAYGKSIGELVVLCESKGFFPTERLFDGGYAIKQNSEYDPSFTQDDITKNMNRLLSKIFEKDK